MYRIYDVEIPSTDIKVGVINHRTIFTPYKIFIREHQIVWEGGSFGKFSL